MRGHLPLIAMRRKGAAPDVVFLDTDPCRLQQWRHWPGDAPRNATVEIEPSDPLHRLDLRCVVGLPVVVTGADSDRVATVAEQCRIAGAGRVVSAMHELRQVGEEIRASIVSTTDTGA